MKLITITAFLFVSSVFAFGQIANDDDAFFNYTYDRAIIKRNKVETVTIQMAFLDGKTLGKNIYQFDKEGLLNKQCIYDSSGNLKREFYFITNCHNDLVSRIQNDLEHKRVDTITYFATYNGSQLIRDSASWMPIGYNYEYSPGGTVLKTVINANVGSVHATKRVILNKLDSLNRIVNSVETVFHGVEDGGGTLLSNRSIFYASNGKVEREVENLNSEYSWMANKGSIAYGYDKRGNLTRVLKASGTSYIYTYNDKGLITSKRGMLALEADAFGGTATSIQTLDKFTYTFR